MGGRKIVSLSVLLLVAIQWTEANPIENRFDGFTGPNPLANRDRFAFPPGLPASQNGLQLGGGLGPGSSPSLGPFGGQDPLAKQGLDFGQGVGFGQRSGLDLPLGRVQRPGLDMPLVQRPVQRPGADLPFVSMQRAGVDLSTSSALGGQEVDQGVDRLRFPGFGFRPPFRRPHFRPDFGPRSDSFLDQNSQLQQSSLNGPDFRMF